MTRTEKRVRFLNLFGQLLTYMTKKNIRGIVAAFYRTAEEQRKLFEDGKSKCDGYKKISPHQNWLAVDIYLLDKDDQIIVASNETYAELGSVWEQLGGVWGGRFEFTKDIFHFEYTA